MNKVLPYAFLMFAGFFWGCLDPDEIIDFREMLYGGCCAFGEEVELTRQFRGNDGQSVFDRNSLFVKSNDDMFLYNNPESYWDFTFRTSEFGIKYDATISPEGNIFAFLNAGDDSTAGTLEFYTQTGGLPIYLFRDLSIKKTSPGEVIQNYEFFDENHVLILLRDDSTGVQRFTTRKYDEQAHKWVWTEQDSLNSDVLIEQNHPIDEFNVLYVSGIEVDNYYLYFIDSQQRFRFFWGGVGQEGGILFFEQWLNGYESRSDTIFASTADFNGRDLLLNKTDGISDRAVLELMVYDSYHGGFFNKREIITDTTGFLHAVNSVQLVKYENVPYVVTANNADPENNQRASVRLFGPSENPDQYKQLQVIYGDDLFASSFDVSLDANMLVIGDPTNDFVSLNAGAVHVYDISLGEALINLDQDLNVRSETDIRAGIKLEWTHLGWNNDLRDSLTYSVYRKIWESGQDFELIGVSKRDGSGSYELLDLTAYLDTNYVYVVVPFNKATNEYGDWEYHESRNSFITKPVNPDLLPKYYQGNSISMAVEGVINSGFLFGEIYSGTFSFTKPSDIEDFTGSVWVDTLIFNFNNGQYSNADMDFRPYVAYENDEFLGIYMIGGTPDNRFGINVWPRSLPEGTPFVYRDWESGIGGSGGFGSVRYSEIETVHLDNDKVLPETLTLSQNYPNPFNPSTNISFILPAAGQVQLKVFNLLGQEVASLVDGRMSQGTHTVTFNAGDLSTGLYMYRLVTSNATITKKMLLTK